MKEYLPSKKFTVIVIVLVILIAVIFGIYKLSIFIRSKFSKGRVSTLVVSPLGNIQKDTNRNGIPDWEESLWGLDPTIEGTANKTIIEKKKSDLAVANSLSNTKEDNQLSDNDVVSREFFAAIMSLTQSGNLTEASMQSVVDAVGNKVTALPIDDIYKKSDLIIKDPTPVFLYEYRAALVKIFTKYQDKNIGDEMTFIEQGIVNNDPSAMKAVLTVASSYRVFSKELVEIPVPNNLAQNHLDLANNYEKTAQTIEEMAKVLTDPIIGMKGLINYNKYNEALIGNINYLSRVSSI